MPRTHRPIVIAAAILLSLSMIGTVAAAPGEGPPDDLPDPVPDFVTDLLNGISQFIGTVLQAVGDLVGAVTPDSAAANPGIGTI